MRINILKISIQDLAFLFMLFSMIFFQTQPSISQNIRFAYNQGDEISDTNVRLVYQDTLILPSAKDFRIYVKMQPSAQISAISLGFYFPEEYLAIDSMELKDQRKGYQMAIEDSLFRMVWSDINPISVDLNDTIITLYMRTLDISTLSNTIRLGLYELSEFADVSATVIEDVVLEIPEIKYFSPGPDDTISGYSVRVYPNPFDDYATIDITLKNESKISMALYGQDGKEALAWEETVFSKGNHLVRIDESDLSKGIYMLKVWIKNDEISATKTLKVLALE